MQTSTRRRYAAGLLAAMGALCWQAPAQAMTYSGDAQVVNVDLTLLGLLGLNVPITVDLVKAGPLPPAGGGPLHDHLLTVGDPAPLQLLLTAEAAHALTVGSGYEASSQAFVASANVGLGPVTPTSLVVSADVLQANSRAVCTLAGRAELTGSANIANLRINGTPIDISGTPNQKVGLIPGLPLVEIVINEQIQSSTANSGDITVNALHIKLLPPGGPLPLDGALTGDVIISQAHSDIHDCPPPEPVCPDPNNPACPLVCPGDSRCPCPNPLRSDCPSCEVKDFVTGGGYALKNGKKVSFSTHGGRGADGSLRNGHLNVVDHSASGPHIKSTGFLDYSGTGLTRSLSFNCTGTSSTTCNVTVTDNGEPGNANAGGTDLWFLKAGDANASCSSAYCAGSTATDRPIAGGNIQLHKPRGCEVVSFGSPPPPPPPPKPCKGRKCG